MIYVYTIYTYLGRKRTIFINFYPIVKYLLLTGSGISTHMAYVTNLIAHIVYAVNLSEFPWM